MVKLKHNRTEYDALLMFVLLWLCQVSKCGGRLLSVGTGRSSGTLIFKVSEEYALETWCDFYAHFIELN